jgi:hypothetical protein
VPRATAIRERLRRMGAGECDRDVLRNGYQLHARSKRETWRSLMMSCYAPRRVSM